MPFSCDSKFVNALALFTSLLPVGLSGDSKCKTFFVAGSTMKIQQFDGFRKSSFLPYEIFPAFLYDDNICWRSANESTGLNFISNAVCDHFLFYRLLGLNCVNLFDFGSE